MRANAIIVALGSASALWGMCLLPRQLRRVRRKAGRDRQAWFDGAMRSPAVARLFTLPMIVGCLAITVGALLWLGE